MSAGDSFSVGDLSQIVQALTRQDHVPSHDYPNSNPTTRRGAERLIRRLESLLFPHEHPWDEAVESTQNGARLELLGVIVWDLAHQIHRAEAHRCESPGGTCPSLERAFRTSLLVAETIPALHTLLEDDVDAAFEGDPAAKTPGEIVVTYPGFYAIMVYRLAHLLFQHNVPLLPRLMTEIAHSQTGIDIHPAAHIGPHFFIDHGTGVVIGETTVIGSRVTLYQGVTLGALNFPRDQNGQIIRGQKRHPTIEDDVVIYSGATILGGTTVIGAGSIIGGNVWLTASVPPGTKVLAQPDIELRAPSN